MPADHSNQPTAMPTRGPSQMKHEPARGVEGVDYMEYFLHHRNKILHAKARLAEMEKKWAQKMWAENNRAAVAKGVMAKINRLRFQSAIAPPMKLSRDNLGRAIHADRV